MYQDKKFRLVSQECQIRRRCKLKQLSRRHHAAEETEEEKEHAEVTLLIQVANTGLTNAILDPQNALLLARAARDVVLAEYQTAYIHIKECELRLETLRDAAEQACATWYDANDQVRTVLSLCDREGIPIDLDPPCDPPLSDLDPMPLFPSLHPTDSDTDCDESSPET